MSHFYCRTEMDHKLLQNAIEAIQKEGLLTVVKVMCDWMKCNTGVIMTCAQVSVAQVSS